MSLFKGNTLNVIRVAPSNAVRYTTYEKLKVVVDGPCAADKQPQNTGVHAGAGRNTDQQNVQHDCGWRFVYALREELTTKAAAGIVSTMTTYPLDLIRSRQRYNHAQLLVNRFSARTSGSATLFQAANEVWSAERLPGFYRGVTTSVYG